MSSAIPIEPGTPDWWGRAVGALQRALNDRPTQPRKLYRVADAAHLPDAKAWPGCLAFVTALGGPVVSDGTFWYPVSLGAHL